MLFVSAEGHPLHTDDVDVSGNAAAAADKSDIPPQASSPLVDTSSTNISETPSKQPASLGEATDDKSSIQQSPRPEEKGIFWLLLKKSILRVSMLIF